MTSSIIRPAKGHQSRGMRLTSEMTLVINAHGSGTDLYEIVPSYVPQIGPTLTFYDVSKGRSPEQRRHLLAISTNGARLMVRWLPMVINAAERLRNATRQQS